MRSIYCALCVAVTGGAVVAAPINYGDLPGIDVIYRQVTETSATDPGPLFGTPSVAASTLLFSASSFGAFTSGGGADNTSGVLTTTIEAISPRGVCEIAFAERGDYTLVGFGTSATLASVVASYSGSITEVDGLPVAPVPFAGFLNLTPSGGTFNLADDAGTGVIWEGTSTINVCAALGLAGVVGVPTKLDFSITNTLSAQSEAGTVAAIRKKSGELFSLTVVVPEPGSLALLAVGLGVLARRNRA